MSEVRYLQELVDDFAVHTLSNQFVSLSLVPELGGRIVSLRDRTSKREWLDGWLPEEGRRLWHPSDPADYGTSPFAGIDDCLPTLLPCQLDGIDLPDHGELWRTQPEFAHRDNHLHCAWQLNCLPLAFRREIYLRKQSVVIAYQLENLSDKPTPFLWTWHPLFRLEEGDQMLTSENFSTCTSPEGEVFPWPSPLPGQNLMQAEIGSADPPCSKVFLGPLKDGKFRIQGQNSGLSLKWPTALIPWAGIWVLRGAWQNLHHWAIEPTNAPVDFLSQAPLNDHTILQGRETRNWEIQLRIQ